MTVHLSMHRTGAKSIEQTRQEDHKDQSIEGTHYHKRSNHDGIRIKRVDEDR